MTSARPWLLVAGLLLAIVAIVGAVFGKDTGLHPEIFPFSLAAAVVLSAAFLAEALDAAPALFEISLGFVIGLMGVHGATALDTLALLGSSAVMFFAGLEMDPSLIARTITRSLAVGLLSFAGPFVVSTLFLRLLGYSLRVALLAATGVSTTSVAVVYAILHATRQVQTELGQILLASTMVADVVSIVVFTALVLHPGKLLVAYIAALVLVPPLLGSLSRRAPRLGHEAEIRIMLALLLSVILFSEAVGIHAVLFSFIVGLALAETASKRTEAMDKIGAVIFGFLAPIFFVTAGMDVAVAELSRCWPIALVLLIASYPSKILATYIGLRLLVPSKNIGLKAANLFAARLTMSSIIAFTGLKSGTLPAELAEAVLLTAIVATLLAGSTSRVAVEEEEAYFSAEIIGHHS